MKHPFQIVLSNKAGSLLFTTSQNQIQVFSTSNGERIGHFIDDFDTKDLIKEKIQKEVEKRQQQEATKEPAKKKQKAEIQDPKVPIPGKGAPKIFNYIRALHLTNDEKYLIAATDSDKAAVIFLIDETNHENILKLVKRQRFPKRPSAITSSADSKDILLGDKFGDVYSITIDSEVTNEKNSETDPLLGHVSMLTDVIIGENNGKQYAISCDRDEHIRISNYPNGFVIENFLFGHNEFISNVLIPSFKKDTLISGGGDDSIFAWDWTQGKLIEKFPLSDIISKYLTESHLSPKKFQNEAGDLKEFCISQIISLDSINAVAVLIEQTNVVLILNLDNDSKLSLEKIIEAQNPIVSITSSQDKLIVSVENDNELLQVFDLASKEFVNSQSFNRISQNSKVEISSKDELFPLYTVSQLRKRSEY